MVRTITVWGLSIAAVFGLFWGYISFVKMPSPTHVSTDNPDALPSPSRAGPNEVVKIPAGGTLPPGGNTGFTVYDPKTGRATDRFRCKEWKKLPGNGSQVEVIEPIIDIQMPSGIMAEISAQRGTLTADRVEQSHIQPKQGVLTGDVKINLVRTSAADPLTPDVTQSQQFTVTSPRIEFDMELGELKTSDHIQVIGEDLEIGGAGFRMIWNQAENKLERLTLEHGDKLMLRVSSDLFGGLAEVAGPETSVEKKSDARNDPKRARKGRSGSDVAAATSKPTSIPASNPAGDDQRRKPSSYACRLQGDIRVEHFRDDKAVGGLTADEMRLLFDLGGNAGEFLNRQHTASRPTEKTDRLELHWSGPLTLDPALPGRSGLRRRQIEADGREVVVKLPQGDVHCGRLVYHDEDRHLWLYPHTGQPLDLKLSNRLHVLTASLFVDRKANIVKLIGPVDLKSVARGGTATRPAADEMEITSQLWAELRLNGEGDSETTEASDLFATGELRSALFVGDVQVRIGERRLAAASLEATFKPQPKAKPNDKKPPRDDDETEIRLDTALANGDVHLMAGSQALSCAEMRVWFGLDKKGEIAPQKVHAVGEVDLQDRGRNVSAQGQRVDATFDENQQVRDAIVFGTDAHAARVYSKPYAVRGPKIEINPAAQSMHVAGKSRLSFRSTRGLRGETYDRPTPIVISCVDDMTADGKTNLIEFVGNVDARSGNEQLLGDSLTLTLQDISGPPVLPSARQQFTDLFAQVRHMALTGKPAAKSAGFGFESAKANTTTRKDLVHGVARNVTVQSKSYDTDGNELVHQSVTAPEMQMDIRERRIRTVGQTILGMQNNAVDDEDRARSGVGAPSALLARGPSTTALECESSLVYVMGADGQNRRDTALFEGGVKMVQVAGREALDPEKLLPKLKSNPELLNRLKNRNSAMICDTLETEFAAAPPHEGKKGGGLSLRWMNAVGHVDFRDQQGPKVRTVNANQVQFDRDANVVRVLGAPHADVRIFDEDTETGQLSTPAVGPEFTIFLDNNTVKTGRVGGEFRRPRD